MSAAAPSATPELPPLRFSRLKLISKSPAHCRYSLDQELAGNDSWDDTPAKRMGRLAHAVFLGQPLPLVYPGDRRGKAWTEFKEAHAGQDIVKQDELDCAIAMAAALTAHDEARELLVGEIEKTNYLTFAGRNCRVTPDVRSWDGRSLTELKTSTDVSPERFPWRARSLGYHAQLAWQKDLLSATGICTPERLSIVGIETKPPFAVCVYGVTPRAEDFGRRLYRGWLEEFLNCERSNHWPGYPAGVLDAPDDALEIGGEDPEIVEVSD